MFVLCKDKHIPEKTQPSKSAMVHDDDWECYHLVMMMLHDVYECYILVKIIIMNAKS